MRHRRSQVSLDSFRGSRCIQGFLHNILLIFKDTDMRLADFILRDMDAILAAWGAFAATQLPAARQMDSPALRDHAREILQAVSKDISTPQSREVVPFVWTEIRVC